MGKEKFEEKVKHEVKTDDFGNVKEEKIEREVKEDD